MFHQVPRRIRRNTPPIAKTTPPTPENTPSIATPIARTITSILTLPNELLLLVASYLRYSDTYHLVCTNRRLAFLLTANLYDDLIKEGMKYLRGHSRGYNTGPIIKVLMSATKMGHSNVVRNLLSRRVPIKGRLYSLQLLELAVLSGCADTVELFLKRGADPNHTYTIRYPNLRREESYISEGESLSGICYSRERVRHFLDMFLARGGTPNETYMRRHLRDQESCTPRAQKSTNKGITLLHIASECDKRGEVIKLLVRYGLDVNSRDVYMMTPLHYAVKCKMVSAILALADCGADVNAVGLSKETPLHVAVAGGVSTANREVVRVLLGLGADRHIKDADGCTAHDVIGIYARRQPRALEMLSLIS